MGLFHNMFVLTNTRPPLNFKARLGRVAKRLISGLQAPTPSRFFLSKTKVEPGCVSLLHRRVRNIDCTGQYLTLRIGWHFYANLALARLR